MTQPLDRVRVLDLGQIFMGPYAGLLLSHMGADVVKVEPPSGENVRGRSADGHPPAFQFFNANKCGVTLDLKTSEGKEALERLVEAADVLIENFRPGTMANLGLGYEDLAAVNPELVYAHGSGYGDTGPYAAAPAMDLAIQARGGVMTTTGFPNVSPVRAGPAVGDILGGTHLAAGIVTALYEREQTGEGQYVEIGMLDCLYPSLASSISAWVQQGEPPARSGNRHSGGSIAPYNAYKAADGYVVIICISDAHWERLTRVMGQPELADNKSFATRGKRTEHVDLVDDIVQGWVAGLDRDAVVDRLLDADVPCAPVQEVDEVVADPQLHSRRMVSFQPNRGSGEQEIPVPGLPIKFPDADEPTVVPAPYLGEHTEEVLRKLGYSAAEINELQTAGVI